MTYPEWFFNVLILASMIALVGVYAFQVWVFASDAREARAERQAQGGAPVDGTPDE